MVLPAQIICAGLPAEVFRGWGAGRGNRTRDCRTATPPAVFTIYQGCGSASGPGFSPFMVIRILLLIKGSTDPLGLHFYPPRLRCNRPRPSEAPIFSFWSPWILILIRNRNRVHFPKQCGSATLVGWWAPVSEMAATVTMYGIVWICYCTIWI